MSVQPTRRRRSTRLQGHDYSQPGIYFVTICTAGRAALFGDVTGGKLRPNGAGRTVQEVWNELPAHYVGHEIDAFVVMPNHVHGIIVLRGAVGAGSPRPTAGAETAPLQPALGQVVAYFKYESTKRLNAMLGRPGARLWHRNYCEHVLRRGESLDRIRDCILQNPARWESDPENPRATRPEPENTWARS